jgi:hypothetical protein
MSQGFLYLYLIPKRHTYRIVVTNLKERSHLGGLCLDERRFILWCSGVWYLEERDGIFLRNDLCPHSRLHDDITHNIAIRVPVFACSRGICFYS